MKRARRLRRDVVEYGEGEESVQVHVHEDVDVDGHGRKALRK